MAEQPQPRTFLVNLLDTPTAACKARDERTGLTVDPDGDALTIGLTQNSTPVWVHAANLTPYPRVSDEEVTDHSDGTYTVGGLADGRTFGVVGRSPKEARADLLVLLDHLERDLPMLRAVVAHIDAGEDERVTRQARKVIETYGATGVGGTGLDLDTVKALLRAGHITAPS